MKHRPDTPKEHSSRVRRSMEKHKYAEGGSVASQRNIPLNLKLGYEGRQTLQDAYSQMRNSAAINDAQLAGSSLQKKRGGKNS